MHIRDYLTKHKLRVVDFATLAKCTTFSVYRWCDGKIPREKQINKIKEITNGEITEKDWGTYTPGIKLHKRTESRKRPKPASSDNMESNEEGEAKV